MTVIFKAANLGYNYEYTFDTLEKFTLWADNWKTVFDKPLEGLMVNTGLMINTFEEVTNDEGTDEVTGEVINV
jgi:hypothetical protein